MAQMLAYRPMNRLLALAFAFAATAALGNPADKDGALVVKATIEPKKIHEACARMEAGEKRRYHWKSNVPVDFNIHYHRGNDISYPVKRSAMRGDGGTFTAKSGEDYCWMWTAKNAPATIEGRIGK